MSSEDNFALTFHKDMIRNTGESHEFSVNLQDQNANFLKN